MSAQSSLPLQPPKPGGRGETRACVSEGKHIPSPTCALALPSRRDLPAPPLLAPPASPSEWVYLLAPSQTSTISSPDPMSLSFSTRPTWPLGTISLSDSEIGWPCLFQLKWSAASTVRCRLAVGLLHAWKTPPVTQMGCMTSVNPSCTALLNLTLR